MDSQAFIQTIRAEYPDVVALRSLTDLDTYEDAVETFAHGGSQLELVAALFALGIPAGQIRSIASYPGRWPRAICPG
ncbi:hypothetical protein [Bradyrhizobium iriomotense]|uniref:Uncharacterized protein n=1 Tax=Bradyrhizobium iriomotense TaxID=441950 RepID=A0ABQ6BC89_9BRAD|nr:hypothetical protein [Bradyrhizobium iriomotense]GLR91320.1 hypothetical protein GCM10007857_80370 [Bradyrhizobium iriomotense]